MPPVHPIDHWRRHRAGDGIGRAGGKRDRLRRSRVLRTGPTRHRAERRSAGTAAAGRVARGRTCSARAPAQAIARDHAARRRARATADECQDVAESGTVDNTVRGGEGAGCDRCSAIVRIPTSFATLPLRPEGLVGPADISDRDHRTFGRDPRPPPRRPFGP